MDRQTTALKIIKNTIACDAYLARQLANDTEIVDLYEKTLADINQFIDQQNLDTKENKMHDECHCEQCTYEPPKSIVEIYRLMVEDIWKNFSELSVAEKIIFLELVGGNL